MRSCLYKFLSLSCIIALFGSSVFAKDYKPINKRHFDSGYTDEKISDDEEAQEIDYYPFVKSKGSMARENVIGIRISEKKITLLGKDKTYSEEWWKEEDFMEADSFSKYPELLSVEICNFNLTRKVLEDIRKFLPMTVKNLIVNSCTVANRDFEEFTDIITRHKQLEFLTIMDPNMARAESAKLLAAVGDLEVIKGLRLTLGELGDEGCNILQKTLEKSKETLSELNIGFMRVKDGPVYDNLLRFLGELKKLKKLEYSVLESTENQVREFFSSLANLKELRDLKICFGDFNSHDGVEAYHNSKALNAALGQLEYLENLDISDMNLPDSVLQTISSALERLTRLKILNVSGNPINEQTAKVLEASLKKMNSLVSFIANNCEMTDSAFSTLCSGLQNDSLRYVYFSGNNIAGSVKSMSVSQMKNLIAINFANNKITLSDIIGFMETIPSETKLEVVNWEGNDFTGLNEHQQIKERNKLKIWKKEHGVNTLDLGI
ncbi:MAG: hypothetical protein K5780_06240 [Alphaproteobacteria bacterium]|nr:hypothetical protein [Alphaproteobacteria bacterium]